MFKNYFKIAIRNFLRYKGYTMLNLLGLAIGIASSLLILAYVTDELSYDGFHKDADRIYRVQYDSYSTVGDHQYSCATAFPGVGPDMKKTFPEVEAFARLYLRYGGGVVGYEDKHFHENNVFNVDQSFFDIFSYELLEGDRSKVLENPNTAVIEEETAKKYFGDEDPIGKRIKFGTNEDYEITGIMRSPENSHLKFTLLLSYKTLYQWGDDMEETLETNWGWYDFYNYIRLVPGVDYKELEAKFPAFIQDHDPEDETYADRTKFSLQPLQDIHLESDLIQEARVNGNGTWVYILTFVALFILVVAWVNYINLATARALQRALEVGIRKVVGARRFQLIRQFIFESVLLNFIAAGLSLLLLELAIPYFNQMTGKEIGLSILSSGNFWLGLTGLFLLGAFLSGLYPAFVLSSFKPVSVLKGRFSHSKSGSSLRKVLVVIQFVFSAALIACTIIVYQQIEFMRNQNLGIDINQTVVVHGPGVIANDSIYSASLSTFKQELVNHTGINQVAASTEVPGNLIYWTNGARNADDPEAPRVILYKVGIDYDFLNAFGNEMLAGRNFSKEYGTDKDAIILNEHAVQKLALGTPEEAVDKFVRSGGDSLRVIGVIANYHQEGLKQNFRTIGFMLRPDASSYYSLKINSNNIGETLSFVEREYNQAFPENPFNYFFLDEFFDKQYKAEKDFGNVFSFFATLAILVACLGLVGLSAFSANRRTKEVGIRKVLGSSIGNIFLLLSKDFLQLVLIANIIAIPLIVIGMNDWLEGFAFRIQLSWVVFFASAALTLLIALTTVSFQAYRAARANPVKALRSE